MPGFSERDRDSPDHREPDGAAPDQGVEIRAHVKWFNVSKGFGFVTPTDGQVDAFLHISVLNRAGLHDVDEGSEVVCRVGPGPKGAQVLTLVAVLGGGDPTRVPPPPRRGPLGGPEREVSGTVKWFKPDKGFGFVAADDGDKDVFVHKSVLRHAGLTRLEPGQRVHLRVGEADKGREATWITLI